MAQDRSVPRGGRCGAGRGTQSLRRRGRQAEGRGQSGVIPTPTLRGACPLFATGIPGLSPGVACSGVTRSGDTRSGDTRSGATHSDTCSRDTCSGDARSGATRSDIRHLRGGATVPAPARLLAKAACVALSCSCPEAPGRPFGPGASTPAAGQGSPLLGFRQGLRWELGPRSSQWTQTDGFPGRESMVAPGGVAGAGVLTLLDICRASSDRRPSAAEAQAPLAFQLKNTIVHAPHFTRASVSGLAFKR